MTATAEERRSSRSPDEQPAQRDLQRDILGVALPRTRMADVTSANGRRQALDPVTSFSAISFSSGSKEVRPVAALHAQVMAAEVQPVAGEELLDALLVQRRPLQLEEQRPGRDRRGPLLHALEEGAPLRVGRVHGEARRRSCPAPNQVLNRHQLGHRVAQAGGVKL